ncbi:MarP family serine protease [Pseudonocardia sp.]|uniref:MarP family serine protease n=1 Tax=Pseudonocardia sp. TaxID=60912 RepID=UPI0026279624|nr:MarP family serine protease [Pseudonocardia sp.]
MSWVDVLVVVLALIAGVSGWRHGMAVALLSFVGVLGGAILGVRLAPLLASGIESNNARIIVSIVVVVVLVALGETTGVYFGRRIRDRITGEHTLRVDSTLGSVLQAITVVIAAWLVALPLASASFPGLASGIRGSEVLRVVDSVMPEGARALPDELRQLLDNSGFPEIFSSPFDRTPIEEIGPPDPSLAGNAVVQQVAGSVLKVRGRAPSCQRALEGTGFVIGNGLVMTNAHVVAGTQDVGVEVLDGRGNPDLLDGDVVLYDPRVDIAVLRIPGLDAPELVFRPRPAQAGEDAIVLGYPLDGPFVASPAKVRQRITLNGPDIYDDGEVSRDVYTVRAMVQSGNSGGPMIDRDGQVVGVVFGAALDDSETGFVLTNEQVAASVNPQAQLGAEVDTGVCAN